tara:strand:- start:318 stop:1061 length:744 start_codon:yes stop_codon:yes gene_type:complete
MHLQKNKFKKNGFFKVENFFDKKTIKKVKKDITNLPKKNVDIYFDKKNKLRRIERLYDKSKNLKNINKKINIFLNNFFGKKFKIFKDKFNAKPPGGEGFDAHYDGIFHYINNNNKIKNGWYEYGNNFINVLIALDNSYKKNGTIQIAKAHRGSFNKLLTNTKKDFTPNLKPSVEKKLKFKIIDLNAGDIVIFKNTCPHRSRKNKSKLDRKTLYYTYLPTKYGFKYKQYFKDKSDSKNSTSKSLSGDI